MTISEFENLPKPEIDQPWAKLNSVTRKTVPRNYKIATDTFTMGRNPEINDLVINDPRLSGSHARIKVTWTIPKRTEVGSTTVSTKKAIVTITDLSTNGTFLNKKLVS